MKSKETMEKHNNCETKHKIHQPTDTLNGRRIGSGRSGGGKLEEGEAIGGWNEKGEETLIGRAKEEAGSCADRREEKKRTRIRKQIRNENLSAVRKRRSREKATERENRIRKRLKENEKVGRERRKMRK